MNNKIFSVHLTLSDSSTEIFRASLADEGFTIIGCDRIGRHTIASSQTQEEHKYGKPIFYTAIMVGPTPPSPQLLTTIKSNFDNGFIRAYEFSAQQ